MYLLCISGFRTSRCLSLVTSDGVVRRDQFYNGNMKLEKTAVVLRVAPTWFRYYSLSILIENIIYLLYYEIVCDEFIQSFLYNLFFYISGLAHWKS